MAKCNIETGAQARKSIGEIRAKTQWTIRRIAVEMDMNPETLRKIVSGITLNPGLYARQQIAKLEARVMGMK